MKEVESKKMKERRWMKEKMKERWMKEDEDE
jgi:hypothetical protein